MGIDATKYIEDRSYMFFWNAIPKFSLHLAKIHGKYVIMKTNFIQQGKKIFEYCNSTLGYSGNLTTVEVPVP